MNIMLISLTSFILFHESITTSDITTTMEEGYYLYGVPQHISNLNYVGFLYCLLHAMETNINDLIDLIIYIEIQYYY